MRHLYFPCGLVFVALAGCGKQVAAHKAEAAAHPAAVTLAAISPVAAQQAEAPAPQAEKTADAAANAAPEEPIWEPATVAETAKVLDLSTFPLIPGSKVGDQRRVVASLRVQSPGDVKGVYEYHRQALVERGWKESGEATISEQSANGSFARDGFRLVLSMFPSGPGEVLVVLQNRGSLNLAKMPVPPGAKQWYAFPDVASFITEAGVEETAAAVRKLLIEHGWEPYGSAGDVMYFKKNAVKLHARVLSPPAQPGKTVIDYSSEQLSAELPAPPDADRVDYYDALKRVTAYSSVGSDPLMDYYRAKLPTAGWTATTENPIRDRTKRMLIFRNAEKDMLTLNVYEGNDQAPARATLEHLTAAEVAEIDRQIEIEQEKLAERRRQEEEEINKPKPRVLVTLPAEARAVDAKPDEIEFQLASGTVYATLEKLIKQFEADGWMLEKPIGNKTAGGLSLKKGPHSISVTYLDPGFIPGQITLTAWGKFELERAGTGKK